MANPFTPLFTNGNRSYFSTFGQQNGGPNFNLTFTTGTAYPSGQWIPLTSTDNGLRVDIGSSQVSASITGGNVTVVNTSPIPVSGSFSTTVTVGDVAVTGGNINVNNFGTLTGQVSQIQTSLNSLTGTISSKWQKVSTNGYQQSIVLTGHLLISQVQGYSNITGVSQEDFIQVFDDITQTGNPVSSIITISRQNWFIDLPSDGVEFNNGIFVGTSSDPVLPIPADNTMFCTVIYKRL